MDIRHQNQAHARLLQWTGGNPFSIIITWRFYKELGSNLLQEQHNQCLCHEWFCLLTCKSSPGTVWWKFWFEWRLYQRQFYDTEIDTELGWHWCGRDSLHVRFVWQPSCIDNWGPIGLDTTDWMAWGIGPTTMLIQSLCRYIEHSPCYASVSFWCIASTVHQHTPMWC